MYSKFAKHNGFISPLDGFLAITQRSDLHSGLFKINPEIQESVKGELASFIAPNGATSMFDLQNVLLRYEIGKFLPSLLQVEDRVTMACGLESRVPLLSTDLIEFMLGLPLEVRLSGNRPKDLMRKAARSDLPAVVLERKDKMGFPVPLASWARNEKKVEVARIISRLRDRQLPMIAIDQLDSILLNPDLGSRNLWACLTLSTWLDNFEE
jgi:asparagine synthetase B (glutamine-hydrolysing)